jgi:hypothetical protein
MLDLGRQHTLSASSHTLAMMTAIALRPREQQPGAHSKPEGIYVDRTDGHNSREHEGRHHATQAEDPGRTTVVQCIFRARRRSCIGGRHARSATVLLRHTPFDTFVVPGIFLGAVIGGSAAIGAIALLAPMRKSLAFSSAAGVIMIGWIAGETLLIEGFSWLQGLYLLTGLTVVAASTERFVGVAGKSLEEQSGALKRVAGA